MKIIYIITSLAIGGAEKMVKELSVRMALMGNEVYIICLSNKLVSPPTLDGLKIVTISFEKSFFKKLNALYKLIKFVKKIKPRVIHSHMFHSNILARIVIIFNPSVFLICSAHSNNEGGIMRMMAYRFTNFLSDIFTNVSQDAVYAFEKKNAVSKGKMKMVYNGINFEVFKKDIKDKRVYDSNSPVFLAVGSFTKLKDYSTLLGSFAIVVNSIPNAKLLIAGDGPLKNDIIQLSYHLNLFSNVNFLGIREDIPYLMGLADIFVLSSSHEGFGLVIAEAMASELFVVATDCGGVKEVIGKYGILTPTKNKKALAESLIYAANLNTQERSEICQSARNRAKDLFDIDIIFQKWKDIYTLKY